MCTQISLFRNMSQAQSADATFRGPSSTSKIICQDIFARQENRRKNLSKNWVFHAGYKPICNKEQRNTKKAIIITCWCSSRKFSHRATRPRANPTRGK